MLCQGTFSSRTSPSRQTVLAKSFARSVGCTFAASNSMDLTQRCDRRLGVQPEDTQFDPLGPIMAQIVLADEINCATPKTQSALLKRWKSASDGGRPHHACPSRLSFWPREPHEYEAPIRLRLSSIAFFASVWASQPDEEIRIPMPNICIPSSIQRAGGDGEPLEVQQEIKGHGSAIKEYIVALVNATRTYPDVFVGAREAAGVVSHGRPRCCRARLRDPR